MAVYTNVSDDDVTALLARYDIGEVTALKGIAEGVENSNYLLRTTTGTFILTLYEKRVDPDDLPFFLGLMDHLSAKGIICPTPVHNRSGQALTRVCRRPAAITSFLDGMGVTKIKPVHCRKLGEALATLHEAAADFRLTRRNTLNPDGWGGLFEKCRARADEVQTGLAAEIDAELDRLVRAWPDDLPRGVIHADLFPDNVFFMPGPTLSGLIDFYFACNDLLAYDIAICLNAWCFEQDGAFNITKSQQLIAGYRSVRPLDTAELTALPLLAAGASLRFLLTRLYDWLNTPQDALVTPKDPHEYLSKLRFHCKARHCRDYGVM